MFFLNHAVYEIMWENTVEPDGPQMTDNMVHEGHLRLQTHTHTHTENMKHVYLIAFPM